MTNESEVEHNTTYKVYGNAINM